MGRIRHWAFCAAAALVVTGAAPARAGEDATQALRLADRLTCAFLRGVTAGFTPQGSVSVKPPLDPNTPGLAIAITDRDKGRAVLEEDDKETPGMFMDTPMGLTFMARGSDGDVTLVTVFAAYSGASDNFPMVSSRHAATTGPQPSQRYGLCRKATSGEDPPAAQSAPPAPGK